jgi:hypothetical protein
MVLMSGLVVCGKKSVFHNAISSPWIFAYVDMKFVVYLVLRWKHPLGTVRKDESSSTCSSLNAFFISTI